MRYRSAITGYGIVFSLAFLVLSVAAADELRTWTDSTGRFKLQAKFVSIEDGKVTLLRDTGESMTIPLTKLSKDDQTFIAGLDAGNPFRPEKESPFKPASPDKAPSTVQDGTSGSSPRMFKVDWSQSNEMPLEATMSEWKMTPPANSIDFVGKSVTLPKKRDFFEKRVGAVVNLVAKRAVVGYTLARRGSKPTTRLVYCDLERGRVLATAIGPGEMAPIALHDNGKHLLMKRNEFGFGKHDRLEVWSVKGTQAGPIVVWTPYDDLRGAARDVLWAEFVDGKTLATSSRHGRVALWDMAAGQPICHFTLVDGSVPSLSADRKWITFASNDRVGMFDVDAREIAVLNETPRKLTWPGVSLSPSGNKIGCVDRDGVVVWDTATGKLEREFGTPGLHLHGNMSFPDDEFILGNSQYLIALESQVKLWHYQGVGRARTLGGTTYLAADGVLIATQLPHREAKTLLAKALNEPDLFVFRGGATVKLDVTGVPAGQRERVKTALTKKLDEMKCPVADNGTITLAASVEGPKQREMRYIGSGTYKVSEYRTHLKFVYQGKPAWQTSSTNIPGIISLGRGENIEGVLRKASKQPSYGFYDRVVLPKFLQKPSGDARPGSGQTLGNSRVTAKGVR